MEALEYQPDEERTQEFLRALAGTPIVAVLGLLFPWNYPGHRGHRECGEGPGLGEVSHWPWDASEQNWCLRLAHV